jgi:NADH-quinone oxidoreductase subunit L
MTVPLAILAFFAMALGIDWNAGVAVVPRVPEWHAAGFDLARICGAGIAGADGDFDVVVFGGSRAGLVALWQQVAEGRRARCAGSGCAIAVGWLRDRLYVDEFYGVTVIAFYEWWARVADWLDRRVWGGVVSGVAWAFADGRI